MNDGLKARKEKRRSQADDDIVSLYLAEVRKIPLLTRQEEDRLARRAAKGDVAAKSKILHANLRFVVNVAKKYQNRGLPLADLISEGNIGLMWAVERFDVDKGCHFISYAVWWIRQAIIKAINDKSRMIRLPLNRLDELTRIEKIREHLWDERITGSEIDTIARRLNLKPRTVADLLDISREVTSLDTPVYSEIDSSVLADLVADSTSRTPEDLAIESSFREDIRGFINKALTRKEAQVIQYRFGLNCLRPMSLSEIGSKYEVTKERIRQIERKCIETLRDRNILQALDGGLPRDGTK